MNFDAWSCVPELSERETGMSVPGVVTLPEVRVWWLAHAAGVIAKPELWNITSRACLEIVRQAFAPSVNSPG